MPRVAEAVRRPCLTSMARTSGQSPKALADRGLCTPSKVAITGDSSSANEPTVVAQDPGPGARVDRGTHLTLTLHSSRERGWSDPVDPSGRSAQGGRRWLGARTGWGHIAAASRRPAKMYGAPLADARGGAQSAGCFCSRRHRPSEPRTAVDAQGARHSPRDVRELEWIRVAERSADRIQEPLAAVDAGGVGGVNTAIERLIREGCEFAVNGLRGIGDHMRRPSIGPEGWERKHAGDGLVVERADVWSGVRVRADGGGDDVEAAGRRDPECRGCRSGWPPIMGAVLQAHAAVRERCGHWMPEPSAPARRRVRLAGGDHASSTSVSVKRASGVGVLVRVDCDQQRKVATVTAAPEAIRETSPQSRHPRRAQPSHWLDTRTPVAI